jgi:acyl-[acyl-carrier-protein] desaturase
MIGMPGVVRGPWTREARELAAAQEAREAFNRFFHKSMKVRNWTPWEDLPLAEMRERGHLLSEDTVTIIQAYLGIENYVGDYVREGLDLAHSQRERRNLLLAWGSEEMKHAEAWELVLIHSGRRTEEQLRDYREGLLVHKWTLREDHPSIDTALGVICYSMLQERATYYNYEEMRKRIRREYGLPERPTEAERERGLEIGAAGAFRMVANDESAHLSIFLEFVRIYLRYLPQDTVATLLKVFNNFKMPAQHLLPDASQLNEALERTLLYTPLKYVRNVRNAVLDALGFEHKRALERAAHEATLLPQGFAPDFVKLLRSGEFVLSPQAAAGG